MAELQKRWIETLYHLKGSNSTPLKRSRQQCTNLHQSKPVEFDGIKKSNQGLMR